MNVLAKPKPTFKVNDVQPTKALLKVNSSYFDYGREALCFGLLSLGLKPGDKVAFPAFFCGTTTDYVQANGFVPVYFDINSNLSFELSDLIELHAAVSIKCLVIPDYFGKKHYPSEGVVDFCIRNNIKLISDRSHCRLMYDPVVFPWHGYVYSMRKQLGVGRGAFWIDKDEPAEPIRSGHKAKLVDRFTFLVRLMIYVLATRFDLLNPYSRAVTCFRRSLKRLKNQEKFSVTATPKPIPLFVLSQINDRLLLSLESARKRNFNDLLSVSFPGTVKPLFSEIATTWSPQVFPILFGGPQFQSQLNDEGIGALRWPGDDLPREVLAAPDKFRVSIQINDSLVCIPVHQSLNMKQIAKIKTFVARVV